MSSKQKFQLFFSLLDLKYECDLVKSVILGLSIPTIKNIGSLFMCVFLILEYHKFTAISSKSCQPISLRHCVKRIRYNTLSLCVVSYSDTTMKSYHKKKSYSK